MVDLSIQQMGLELGSGAVIGGIIGFAAKKVAKLIAVLVGLELALFKFLESQGILTVDWERLSAGMINASTAATDAASGGEPPSIVMSFLSIMPVSAGFTGGFFLGFKKG